MPEICHEEDEATLVINGDHQSVSARQMRRPDGRSEINVVIQPVPSELERLIGVGQDGYETIKYEGPVETNAKTKQVRVEVVQKKTRLGGSEEVMKFVSTGEPEYGG